jgi:hypothetical protein
MAYQIEIKYNGVYQIDADTRIENPLVIGASANDDLIETVYVSVYFTSPTYYLGREIGSFNYVGDWSNTDVVSLINGFMATHEVAP